MAVTVTGGPLSQRGPGWWTRENLTQSTATAFQAVSLFTDVTTLGVGTATGFGLNRYGLASGATEGREKVLLTTGTGEAKAYVAGTATGLWVLNELDDMVMVRYIEGKWRVIQSTATLASGT